LTGYTSFKYSNSWEYEVHVAGMEGCGRAQPPT